MEDARSIRILVVDDEPECRTFVRLALEAEGFSVREASGPTTARSAVRDGARPDLAIVDVHLGGDSGHDLARELEASLPGLRVLLVSGHPEADPGERPFLGKPLRQSRLVQRVRELTSTGGGRR